MRPRFTAILLTAALASHLAILQPVQAWPELTVEEMRAANHQFDQTRDRGNLPVELEGVIRMLNAELSAQGPGTGEWLLRARLEAKIGRYDDARTSLAMANETVSGKFEKAEQVMLHLVQWQIAFFQGQFEQAQAELKQTLALDPGQFEAQALLAKTEKALRAPAAPRPCNQPFDALMKLPLIQIYDCVKAAPVGDPSLNTLLFRLGEAGGTTYVTTLAPLLKAAPHHRAALAALGRVIGVRQITLVEPYLKEDDTLAVITEVLRRQPTEIDEGLRQRIGPPLLKELQAAKIDRDNYRLLLLIDLLGALRLRQALPALQRLKRIADDRQNGRTGYGMEDADFGTALFQQVDWAIAEFAKTPLMLAAASGRLDQVRQLLAKGAKPAAKTPVGESALSLAAARGYHEIVAALLAKGVSPNSTGTEAEPVLVQASRLGQLEVVRLLLAKGAKIAAKKEDGVTAIEAAIAAGQLETVKLLARAKGGLEPDKGLTPLNTAINTNQVEVVKFLLELGVKPEKENVSTLASAVQMKNQAIIALLLEHGASPNTDEGTSDQPLINAIKYPVQPEVVKLLLAHGAEPNLRGAEDVTALMAAAGGESQEVFRLLMTQPGITLDAVDARGRTVLMYAADSLITEPDMLERVSQLLEKGADVKARSQEGETALTLASNKSQLSVVKRLLTAGADPAARDEEGNTALSLAAKKGNAELVTLLLAFKPAVPELTQALLKAAERDDATEIARQLVELGADVKAKDEKGETALLFAASRGNLNLARLLLDRGADPNARNDYGRTVLCQASGYDAKPELVRLLLEKGANPNLADSEGETPLMLAASFNNLEILKLLVSKGANPKARNKEGETALDQAKNGIAAPEAVKYLQSLK